MSHLRTVFVAFISMQLLGCSLSAYREPNRNIIESKTETARISKETAVYVARGYLIYDYDFRGCDVEVVDESAWKVAFSLKVESPGLIGGCPTVWIDKNDGSIINVMHNK
ncbi:MAG: hypothetical protein IPJ30_23050 [Acidobacteria bacterium]|nr:hypothetical protein [Acidobacteriota bacterium]MBK8147770.1 hypothetical protein [Acidobacteriota bacterium]